MAYTNVWDCSQPPDTQAANLLGQDLRTFRLDTMQRIAFLSGTLANQPTPETTGPNVNWTGLLYFATDTSQVFQWSGTAWLDISDSMIAGALFSSGGPVVIDPTPPTAGLPLIATGPHAAAWGGSATGLGFKLEDVNTTPVTIANSIGVAALYSFNLPANELGTGQILRVRLFGEYSALMSPPATPELDVEIDSTLVAAFPMQGTIETANHYRWNFEFYLFCLTGGSSGVVEGHGSWVLWLPPASGGTILGGGGQAIGLAPTTQSFDLTAAHTLNVNFAWGVADPGDTITRRLACLERLG